MKRPSEQRTQRRPRGGRPGGNAPRPLAASSNGRRPPRLRRPAEPSRAELLAQIDQLQVNLELERQQIEAEESTLIQAQHELELSRDRYVALYELAPVGYITLNRQGLVCDANVAAGTLLGRDRSQLIGYPLATFVVMEDRRALREHFWHARREGRPQAAELRFKAAGEDRPVIRLITSHGEDAIEGRRLFRVALTDVTEQRRIEEALRESEARFRTMADSAPVLIWMSGLDQRCTWFNQVWLEFVGRTMDQELGHGWEENVHPEHLNRWVNSAMEAFDARREFRMEFLLRRHDGQWRWMLNHGRPLHGPGQAFTGFIGSCVDITERKQSEVRLQSKQQELQVVADHTPVMLTRCGRDLRYHFVNRACADMFGLTPDQIIGKPIREILGEPAFQTILPYIERVLNGEQVEYELELPYAGSGQRFVHVAYVPETDQHGQVAGWVAAINDITERRLEERRLLARDAISRTLAEADTVLAAAPRILQTLCEGTDWDAGAMWLAGPQEPELRCVGFWCRPDAPAPAFEADTRGRRFARGHAVVGTVWSTGQPVAAWDLATQRDTLRAPAAAKDGFRSGCCYPIKLEDTVLGAIECFSRLRRDVTPGFLKMLAAVSDKLGQFAERKRAEAALRLSEERMRHILETALDAVITIEANGLITGWNPQAEQIFGWTAREALGRKLVDTIIPSRYRAAHKRGMRDYLDTGQGPMLHKRQELVALHRSGREFPVEIAITPLALEDRLCFGAFLRDITERKAAVIALQRHVEDLAAANEDLARFNRLAVGRELRMIELKKQVNALSQQAGLPPLHALAFDPESDDNPPPPDPRSTLP